ncbi:MAG: hypothetical protein U1A77_03200 [Pirellulales bacterium]
MLTSPSVFAGRSTRANSRTKSQVNTFFAIPPPQRKILSPKEKMEKEEGKKEEGKNKPNDQQPTTNNQQPMTNDQ